MSKFIGHKTFYSKERGYWHEPLTQDEADAILKRIDIAAKKRCELMPDEEAAIRMFFESWQRLKELGWREAIYCPKDGTEFLVIEPGSTGKHRCVYQGEWPKGNWLVLEDGDMWPSRPALFKVKEQI